MSQLRECRCGSSGRVLRSWPTQDGIVRQKRCRCGRRWRTVEISQDRLADLHVANALIRRARRAGDDLQPLISELHRLAQKLSSVGSLEEDDAGADKGPGRGAAASGQGPPGLEPGAQDGTDDVRPPQRSRADRGEQDDCAHAQE